MTNDSQKQVLPLSGKKRAGNNRDTNFMVKIMSFGYKEGELPSANIIFDVRFLKNPYWIAELRPLSGLDLPVQDYVLQQPLTQEFLSSVLELLNAVLPKMAELGAADFTIAFGCTGGQHRSVSLVEILYGKLSERFPNLQFSRYHRELCNETPFGYDERVRAEKQ